MYERETLVAAYAKVEIFADYVWMRRDPQGYVRANQELWMRECRDQFRAECSPLHHTVFDMIPDSRLAVYGNYRYNMAREKTYMPHSSSCSSSSSNATPKEPADLAVRPLVSATSLLAEPPDECWEWAEVEEAFCQLTDPVHNRRGRPGARRRSVSIYEATPSTTTTAATMAEDGDELERQALEQYRPASVPLPSCYSSLSSPLLLAPSFLSLPGNNFVTVESMITAKFQELESLAMEQYAAGSAAEEAAAVATAGSSSGVQPAAAQALSDTATTRHPVLLVHWRLLQVAIAAAAAIPATKHR